MRFANYIRTLRMELLHLSRAMGHVHPALVRRDQFELLDGRFGSAPLDSVFGLADGWGELPAADVVEVTRTMAALLPVGAPA